MPQASENRRHFQRILFHRPLQLSLPGSQLPGQLLDISLKGALLECPQWQPELGEQARLQVELGDVEPFNIDIEVQVAHAEDGHIGVRITSLDLQSASRLRRLVEWNLADPQLLERELQQLIAEA